MDEYKRWMASNSITDEERAELTSIENNEKEIESRFYAPLQFGTAGLRGAMGAGINRMNIHTVRQATQGIANLIKGSGTDACSRGVAVCMDCRINSDVFAREVSCVLAGNGINVYLFDALRPTPELSFAIRELKCIAGINITASHNPKEYNGYKAYWEDGAQLPPDHADVVIKAIEETDIFNGIIITDYESAISSGKIKIIGEEIDEKFLSHVLSQAINKEAVNKAAEKFKVVYTPFHGTGYKLVPEALRRLGLKNIICVPEQMVIDGTFPTVKSPNPENKEGFEIAIDLAKKENVDLIIGTDPDADRVGIILRNNAGDYVTLSGNQVGVLLLDYIIKAKAQNGTLPKNAAAIKTIVTTEMARKVGRENKVEVFDTFTGFKFMAEKIKQFEDEKSFSFILAYEESYGYLMGDYCRDKDAVTASMMIAEMAAFYHNKDMTLYDAMEALYEKYGFYSESTINLVMPGLDGIEKMQNLMNRMRSDPPKELAGVKVNRVRDYLPGTITDLKTGEKSNMELSKSNVLYFEIEDKTSFIIRPSGTEPKVKIYILTSGNSKEECKEKIDKYTKEAEAMKQ